MANIITNNNKGFNVSVNYNVMTYKPGFTKNGKPGLFTEVTDTATGEIYRLAILGREADRVKAAVEGKEIRGAIWSVQGNLAKAANGTTFLNTTAVGFKAEAPAAVQATAEAAPVAETKPAKRARKAK